MKHLAERGTDSSFDDNITSVEPETGLFLFEISK